MDTAPLGRAQGRASLKRLRAVTTPPVPVSEEATADAAFAAIAPHQPGDLLRLAVFKDLTFEQLEAAFHVLSVRKTTCGDVYSGDGAQQQRFFIVWSGAHRATIMSPSGQHITIRPLRPGDHFGEFAILSGAAQSYYNVVSDTAGLILQVSAPEFCRLIDEIPAFRRNVLASMSREALLCADRIFEFAALNGRVRLQAELLRLCGAATERGGAVIISPAPTHEALASQIGARV